VTTDFHYSDQWQVLEERGGGETTVQYVWSPVYVDAMVLRDRDTDGDGTLDERLWVVQDANYNVTALLDNAGNVVERYVYDPFGQATVLDAEWNVRADGSAYDWLYLHQGGRYDVTSGLYHFRFRDYSPTLGRWTSLDPLSYAAGDVNLYRPLGNNPLNSLDPSGLDRIDYHDDGTGQTLVWYVPERWFWRGDGPRQFVGVLVQVNGQFYVRRYIDRQALFVPLHLVEQTTGFWADSVKDWKQWFQQNGQTDLSSTVASGWAQEFGVDLTRTVAELRQTGINAYRDIYIIGTSTAIALAMVPAGRRLVTASKGANRPLAGRTDRAMPPSGSRTTTSLSTSAGRPFRDRIKDYQQDPSRWEIISMHTEPATRRGARQSGVSIQIQYRNRDTGEIIWRHQVIDDRGRVVDDHFRPYYKPRVGDLRNDF
jgi:RHS repeat-associated protein